MPTAIGHQRSIDHRATGLRLIAAAAILVGGLIHLQLYYDGYRDVPNQNLGRSFILNAVASVVIASALLARRHVLVRLAGIGLVAGTLIAFALSRTDEGIFGFSENGLDPSPQALVALIAESLALLLLTASFVPTIGPGDDLATSAVAPVAGLAVIGAVVGGALWARTPAAPEVSEDTTITIENFTFVPDPLTVAAGSSATWTNTDAFEHSIVGDDGSFTSEVLGQGDTFAFEFGSAGEFTYKCGIHPTMTGTIEVTE